MTRDLLLAPERKQIEAFLNNSETSSRPATYERLLGFLCGVVVTPGPLMPSQWMQPLLDRNGIVFQNIDDANNFTSALMPLYNRIQDLNLRDQNLCPFELNNPETLESLQEAATDWAIGLHDALRLQADVWAPPGAEAVQHVPQELLEQMNGAIPFLWALAEPQAIPEIMPDPVPFQKNFLSKAPGWQNFMMRKTWDEELMEMFGLFCLGQLKPAMDTLQRYAKAYDSGDKGAPSAFARQPVVRDAAKVGRNDPCPCGSGNKFKKCCGA